MKRRFVIGIVGPSGAGKSSLCKLLKKKSKQFEHVKLDNYFKSPKTFPKKHGFLNWEVPSNLKFNILLSDLKKLKAGKVVKTKTFPKAKGAKPEPLTLYPRKYILVEGFLLYKNKEIRDFLDQKIYLDVPKRIMLARRKIRFGAQHVNDYDTKVAIPEFLKHGVRQKKYADDIVNADRPQTEVMREVKAIINGLF
ncbi:MAG: ATP-binding cassette domain-containing protein [bacterium]|nr:ATP-binding cassette domain-containing protein [bacterium]